MIISFFSLFGNSTVFFRFLHKKEEFSVDNAKRFNYNIQATVERCAMLLDLRQIIEVPGKSVPFECELSTDGLEFDSIKEYITPPTAEGRVFNEAGILTLEGTLTAEMTCVCDRCGKLFDSVKVMDLHAFISDRESEDPEVFVLDGDNLDLDETLSTLFILDMETKFLCSEDCKGLCSRCGADLNLGPCACGKEIDPRLAVLQQLLDND